MIDYDIIYTDGEGNKKDYVITSVNARTAMNNLFELCPEARQIISCKPRPMFEG